VNKSTKVSKRRGRRNRATVRNLALKLGLPKGQGRLNNRARSRAAAQSGKARGSGGPPPPRKIFELVLRGAPGIGRSYSFIDCLTTILDMGFSTASSKVGQAEAGLNPVLASNLNRSALDTLRERLSPTISFYYTGIRERDIETGERQWVQL